MAKRGPFRAPLDWPPEQPRARRRLDGPYRVTLNQAQEELVAELKRFKATDIVISTNVKVRRDGFMYATGSRVDDPGVAVYWSRGKQDYVMACDQYKTIDANVRACGLAIYHLRRLEQAAPAFAEKAFSGFARLPADTSIVPKRAWRLVMGFSEYSSPVRGEINKRYRQLTAQRHPDSGGSTEAMQELNEALREALEEIG